MDNVETMNYEREIPAIFEHMLSLNETIANSGLETSLYHLVLLRVSQINRCGYCVQMHTREARADGETNARLDHVIVWDQVDDFSAREKAAFAYCEALTRLDSATDFSALRAVLRQHFSAQEACALTTLTGMINLWNRLQVANH